MAKSKTSGWVLLREYISSDSSSERAKDDKGLQIFRDVFGKDFKRESDAVGADGYVEGRLVVELKSKYKDWCSGLFQAYHYKKKGLGFQYLTVITHQFIGLWKVDELPEKFIEIAEAADPMLAPSAAGVENNKKTNQADRKDILSSSRFLIEPKNFKRSRKQKDVEMKSGDEPVSILHRTNEYLNYLKNLESGRIQINPENFILKIRMMTDFFEKPIDAIHAFYEFVNYWDTTSTLPEPRFPDDPKLEMLGRNGKKRSDSVVVPLPHHAELRRFVENHFVFTNEDSGLTYDYYFSRFDEVLADIDPEYVKQHGIFFTDDNLSKFALWYVQAYVDKDISDKYIVIDPAGGSGNLVTSWRMQVRHKIVSELQPDLLRIIDRRMRFDNAHMKQGFTVVPKISSGKGLNFLDKSAEKYIDILENALAEKKLKLDKPLAFLVNPPYKNTDENKSGREGVDAEYDIDPSILELTGNDAGKERYLAFLAQILNICKQQVEKNDVSNPLMMIFTPTSWLIPRPAYIGFRNTFDQHFEFLDGFMVKAGEFFKFKGSGSWPACFTIWKYAPDLNRKNTIELNDLTAWSKEQLEEVNWLQERTYIHSFLQKLMDEQASSVVLKMRGDIRNQLPQMGGRRQPRYDFSRAKKADEKGKLVSGFPLADRYNHFGLSRTCGVPDGEFVGFMDDLTPVRLRQDKYERMSNEPDRVWFRLDNDFKTGNRSRAFGGAPDKYGYFANDSETAKITFTWLVALKTLVGSLPLWANQLDVWYDDKFNTPKWLSLVYAFALETNDCIVTKFEADNPVPGAPEVFVDNPMALTHPENFWSQVLAPHASEHPLAKDLVDAVTHVYELWNQEVTQGSHTVYGYGLEDEPYFKYFDYEPFVTPYSGLVQIRKVVEDQGLANIEDALTDATKLRNAVKAELHRMLVEDFRYFD